MSAKSKKALSVLDRAVIVLFTMFLWLTSIMLPAVCIAQSEGFYHTQLEKTGIYAQVDENGVEQDRAYIYWVGGDPYQVAQFSNEQLDTIVSHIIDYLFTDQESFALTMDGVLLNGQVQDGVEIFSETSVSHMVDVKELFSLVIVLTIVFALLTVGLGVYIILRRKHLARFIVKYSVLFYLGFLAAAGLFLGWVALDAKANDTTFASQMWSNFHHILFPFQADKFSGSFFNDTLTCILSLDFFLAAVYTVLIIMAIIVAVWIACTVLIKRLYK